jgi:rubrerythrin
MKLKDALRKAIELEEWGHAFYMESAERTRNTEGASMFRFLAGEEVKHAQVIRKMLADGTIDKELEVLIPYAGEIETTIFKRKIAGGRADEKADSLEALNIGIEAEKNSIEFGD